MKRPRGRPRCSPSTGEEEEKTEAEQQQHVIRFTTQVDDPIWPFWLEVPHGDAEVQPAAGSSTKKAVRVELSVSYLDRTDVMDSFLQRMPPWVAETWYATVYFSEWEF